MTPKLLLRVEDSFLISERALIVVPPVPLEIYEERTIKNGHPILVRLVHPDGLQEEVQAVLWWERSRVSLNLVCAFPHATKDQVPIGTEVWLLEEF